MGGDANLKSGIVIDAILEMVCEYQIPADVVLGVLYNSMMNWGIGDIKTDSLPTSQIPSHIRKIDDELKFSPTHRIVTRDGAVEIGENILRIIEKTKGDWYSHREFINRVLEVFKTEIRIKIISQLGLRYLHFFTGNIFGADNMKLKVVLEGEKVSYSSMIFRTEIPHRDNIVGLVQITNGVHVINQDLQIDHDGSLIDLKAVTSEVSIDSLLSVIDEIHQATDEIFRRFVHVK